MRSTVALLAVVGALSHLSAQGPTASPGQRTVADFVPSGTERKLIVEGCIRGDKLKIDLGEPSVAVRLLEVKELRLEGPEELMQKLLKEHDGHQDEITGVVVIPADRDTEIGSTRTGGTRVTTGSGTSTRARQTPALDWMPFRVMSVRHLAEKCSIR